MYKKKGKDREEAGRKNKEKGKEELRGKNRTIKKPSTKRAKGCEKG